MINDENLIKKYVSKSDTDNTIWVSVKVLYRVRDLLLLQQSFYSNRKKTILDQCKQREAALMDFINDVIEVDNYYQQKQ